MIISKKKYKTSCLLYVFGVAETKSEVHFIPSRQVSDITSKSLHSHTKIKNNSGQGVRSFLLYVFGVAETDSEVHFAPSRQVFDITSKSLHNHTKIKNNSGQGVRPFLLCIFEVAELNPNPKSILPHHVRFLI